MYRSEQYDIICKLTNDVQELTQVMKNIVKPPEEVIYDDVDLCNFLKISRRTSAYWREKGMITYCKLGGKIYYRLSDILRMMKDHEIPAVTKDMNL